MPNLWLFLFIVSFLPGQLFRFSFFSPDVHFLPLDLFIALFVSLNFLSRPREYFVAFKTSPLAKPLIGFLSVGLLSLVIAYFRYGQTAFLVGLFYWLRFAAYSLSIFPFSKVFKHSTTNILIALGICMSLGGLFQYAIHPDIRSLAVSEWDPHYYRVVGNLLDPGFLGIIYVFTLILISLHERKINLFKWVVVYLPFVLTYSRSSYLAYGTAMACIAFYKKSWKFLVITLALLFISLPLLPRASDGEGVKLERTSTIQARLVNWGNSLQVVARYPVLGVGFNTYRYAQKEFGFVGGSKWLQSHAGAGADSSLLFAAATTGIVGLSFYLWYLYTLFNLGNPNRSSTISKERSGENLKLKITLITLLAHSFFLNSLFYPFVMAWLSLLASKNITETRNSP